VSGPLEGFVRVEEEVEVGLRGVFFDGFFDEGEGAGFGRGVSVLREGRKVSKVRERREKGKTHSVADQPDKSLSEDLAADLAV
jgi:hypothetical protein